MSTALQPFTFTGQQVRVITDEHGEPWFVAADVAAILDLGNVRSSLALLDEDEKGVHSVDTPGGAQQVTTVCESGLYSLVLRSRKDEAKAFKRWITRDVLPAIRRTGSYSTAPALPTEIDAGMLRQIAAAMEAKDQRIAELEPQAAIANTLMSAEGDLSLREAAQTLCRDHGIDTGQNRLLAHLRSIGWVDRKGLPYQEQINNGRLSVRTQPYTHPHTDEPMLSYQLRVTGKGLTWLHTNWPRPNGGLTAISGGAA